MSKVTKATTLHTCLTCADIPSVQNQIELLLPMLLEEFDDNTERALDALLLDLTDYETFEAEQDEDDTFFIATLWLSMVGDMGSLDIEIDRAALVSGRTLVRSGATSVTAPLSAALREIAQPSADDLKFWFSRVLVTSPSIETEFTALVRTYLSGDRSTAGKIALVENIRQLLLKARRSVAVALDLWAYRWHSIGAFEGLVAVHGPEVSIVAFNNPPSGPDSRTTPFCRWVHGRVIEVRRARRQIQSFLNAVSLRDANAAMAAWPILDATDASGEGVSFEVSFRAQALPPYHFFCRTVPRAAR